MKIGKSREIDKVREIVKVRRDWFRKIGKETESKEITIQEDGYKNKKKVKTVERV